MAKKDRAANRAERAAAIQAEQTRKERNRRLLIGLVVVVVLAAVVVAGVLISGRGSDPAASGDAPKASASGQALVVGNDPDAVTKVVIYEDFLCPYCRELEAASRDFLHTEAKKGSVLVEYRPFQLLQDDYSAQALNAFAAVLQGGTGQQALRFHDLLFDNQPYEAATDKPGVDDLVDLAGEAGVTDPDVIAAIKEPDQAFADAASSAAEKAGVDGTPTVFVNGEKLQGSVTEMSDQIKQIVAQG